MKKLSAICTVSVMSVLLLAVIALAGCGSQPAEVVPKSPADAAATTAPTAVATATSSPSSAATPGSEATLAAEPADAGSSRGMLTIPHQVEGREACRACHGEQALSPFPSDHGGRPDDSCSDCHQQSGLTPPLITHDVEGRDDCLMCHAVEGGALPSPSDHEGRSAGLCRVCHVLAPEAVPEPGRKSGPLLAIPHDVDGKENCLECHGAGAVAAYPDDHAGRENEQCQACHLPGDRLPVPVAHTLEARDDCRMCHAADAFSPFPSDHRKRGNESCLLCHSIVQ